MFSIIDPASADPTQLVGQTLDAVQNGNGWMAAGPALSLVVWLLLRYDKSIPKVGPVIDRFLNLPLVSFLLPTVLSSAAGLFSALAAHQAIAPALLAALKVSAAAAFTFLALKNGSEQMKGAALPDVAKAAPMVLLCLAVGLGSSCAHTDAIVVTKDTIHATRLAVQATAAGMKSADDQHLLTAKEVQRWNLFLKRFNALFHVAADTWDAAAEVHDEDASTQAAAILSKLMGELASFAIDIAAAPAAPASNLGGPNPSYCLRDHLVCHGDFCEAVCEVAQ